MGSMVITGFVVFALSLVGQNAVWNARRLIDASARRASGSHRIELPAMTSVDYVATQVLLVLVCPIVGWFVVCASSVGQHRQVVAAIARGALPIVAERAGWCADCVSAVDDEILMWAQS